MWTTEARASVLVDDGGHEDVMWTTEGTKLMWMKTRLLGKEGSIFVNVFPLFWKRMNTSSSRRSGKGSRQRKTLSYPTVESTDRILVLTGCKGNFRVVWRTAEPAQRWPRNGSREQVYHTIRLLRQRPKGLKAALLVPGSSLTYTGLCCLHCFRPPQFSPGCRVSYPQGQSHHSQP